MDWTDRHDRFFLRLISRHALLYTEMVTAKAIIHGDRQRLLAFNEEEHPVALQLGGSDPQELAFAAEVGARDFGYDEINLNVGCPSDRVQNGLFGACLMAEPELVRDCVSAMAGAVSCPVTVKCRIGINGRDQLAHLFEFIETVRKSGCSTFIIHARIAVLSGLSPKQNREIPPLRYGDVYAVKDRYPELEIIINGGVTSLEQAESHLNYVNGVMMGRAAYQTPFVLSRVDTDFYGSRKPVNDRFAIVEQLVPYIESELDNGVPLSRMTRHILGLFQGQPGAKGWRRHLSTFAPRPGAGVGVVWDALEIVSAAQKDRPQTLAA